MACGAYHTVALSRRGEVFTFGDGESGALGLADRGDASTHRAALPTLVTALHQLAEARDEATEARRRRAATGDFGYDSSAARDGGGLAGSGGGGSALDGSGHGVVRAVAAGHLTSAAVDDLGRLYVWGCPYAEDGVQPSPDELLPRRAKVASSTAVPGAGDVDDDDDDGGFAVFRSVGMGGYHTVAVTEVFDRWGRPFGGTFEGLPKGLQLPTAKHREKSKAEKEEEEVAAALAKQERERRERAAAVKGLGGSLLAGGGRPLDPMVGRLRVGAGTGAGPSGRAGYDHPGRTHQALFVAPQITAPRPKAKR